MFKALFFIILFLPWPLIGEGIVLPPKDAPIKESFPIGSCERLCIKGSLFAAEHKEVKSRGAIIGIRFYDAQSNRVAFAKWPQSEILDASFQYVPVEPGKSPFVFVIDTPVGAVRADVLMARWQDIGPVYFSGFVISKGAGLLWIAVFFTCVVALFIIPKLIVMPCKLLFRFVLERRIGKWFSACVLRRKMRWFNVDSARQKVIGWFLAFCNFLIAVIFLLVFGNVLIKNVTVYSALVGCGVALVLMLICHAGRCRSVFLRAWPTMIVAQLFLAYFLMVKYSSWDVMAVTENARNLALGKNVNYDYFAGYTNNVMCFILQAGLFWLGNAILGSTSIYILAVVNIGVIAVSIWLAIHIAQYLTSGDRQYLVGVLMLIYAPFYLWIPICYTDLLCIPFILAAAELILRIGKGDAGKGRSVYVCCIRLALVLSIGYCVKGSCAILLLAGLIYWWVYMPVKRFLSVAIPVAFVFFAVVFSWSKCVSSLVTSESIERYKFPITHWIMMGLRDNGQWNGDDVKHTRSFLTYQEKVDWTRSQIAKRMAEKGLVGTFVHWYEKATMRCWQKGTCNAELYLGGARDAPLRRNVMHEFVLSSGRWHFVLQEVSNGIYWVAIIFLIVNVISSCMGRRESGALLLKMILMGGVLFFMVWETNLRFSLHLMPMLLIVAATEIGKVSISREKLKKWLKRFQSLVVEGP